jgi:hypothetical protein
MATKSDFTPEQWGKLVQAPLLADFAVSAADPSGLIGTLQEGMASARALAAAKSDPSSDALIKAVVEDLLTAEGRAAARKRVQSLIQGAELSQIKARALAELGEAGKILDTVAPADAGPFKKWLNAVANSVAEAASEGGFLGFGGVKVSEAERATLGEISTALGA